MSSEPLSQPHIAYPQQAGHGVAAKAMRSAPVKTSCIAQPMNDASNGLTRYRPNGHEAPSIDASAEEP